MKTNSILVQKKIEKQFESRIKDLTKKRKQIQKELEIVQKKTKKLKKESETLQEEMFKEIFNGI